MLSFFGYDDVTREQEQGHSTGQPNGQTPFVQETYAESDVGRETFVEGPRVVQEPNNMVRYLGSTADGKFMQNPTVSGRFTPPFQQQPIFMQNPVVNGHSTPPFQQQPIVMQKLVVNGHSTGPFQQQPVAPYLLSTVSSAPVDPTLSKKVVSERAISRDELFSTGNLVEAPEQKITSPPEVSPLLMDVPGKSVRMNAAPTLVTNMPMQVQMPVPMGGSVRLSPAPVGGAVMVPGGSVQMSAQGMGGPGTVIVAPQVGGLAAPPLPGGSVQMSDQVMGGPRTFIAAPQVGGFAAPPPPGGSVQMSAQGMGGPGNVIVAPQVGGFTAAPPPGAVPQVASSAMGGSMQMSAAPVGMPQGGSITMPVARPTGGFVRQLIPQMGGPPQIGGPMQSMPVLPGGSYTAPAMQAMMAAPGGSYTAAPMQPMIGVPGGSFTAPPMQPMMTAPGGFIMGAPMQPMMGAPGGSFTAAPMVAAPMAAPMNMQGNFVRPVNLPQADKPLEGRSPSMRVEMA